MRNWIFVLFFFACGSLFASRESHYKPTAWLLVGINSYEGTRPVYPLLMDETRDEQLFRLFREGFEGLDIRLKFKYRATQMDLFDALNDADSVAVFWVGHAASLDRGALAPSGRLIDADGNEMGSVFKHIHPNLRYLAVIGCESRNMLDQFRESGFYRNNPLLRIEGFSREDLVEASVALHGKVRTAATYLVTTAPWRSSFDQRCYEQRWGQPFLIVRTAAQNQRSSPLRLETWSRVFAVLPSAQPGETQRSWFWLDANELKNDEVNLELIATDRGKQVDRFGRIQIISGIPDVGWTPLSFQGRPLGVTERVYSLTSKISNWPLRRGPC